MAYIELLDVLRDWGEEELDEETFIDYWMCHEKRKLILKELLYMLDMNKPFITDLMTIIDGVCELWRLVQVYEEKYPDNKFISLQEADDKWHVIYDP